MATEVLADPRGLRTARRERAFAQVEAHDLDALILGREANARYVTGAPRLWTAGSRAFGPGCVVIRESGAMYLLSTWDEGIPEEIPHENLFGITWNPGNLFGWLKGIDGLAKAKRIGTDGQTPRFATMLPRLFPDAEFVDAEPALAAARRIKTSGEIEAIKASIEVAEAALAITVAALEPGTAVRRLAGVFMDAMASLGVTTPATQRVAWTASGRDVVEAGDMVAFDAAIVRDGYTGEVGRTWPIGGDPTAAFARADRLWDALLEACRPGNACTALLDAYGAAGADLPPHPIATGLGLGFDTPVVTGQLPATAASQQLDAGMVLAVTVATDGVFRKEAVLITAGRPEVLTTSRHWHP